MIERAGWRTEVGRPTPAQLALGFARWRGVPLTVLVFGFAVAYALAEGLAHALVDKEWRVLFTSPLAGFGYIGWTAVLRRSRRRLAPDPAPLPIFPVRVRFRAGDKVRGADEGVISFADGWLVYEGERTAFSLCAADAKVLHVGRVTHLGLPESQVLELRARSNGRELKVALRRWESEPRAHGLSRLPPLDAHPSAQARFAFGLQALGAFLFGLSVGALLTGPLLGRFPSERGLTLVAVCALIAASFSCFGQALVTPARPRRLPES